MRSLSADTRAQWALGIVLVMIAGYLDGYGLIATLSLAMGMMNPWQRCSRSATRPASGERKNGRCGFVLSCALPSGLGRIMQWLLLRMFP